MLHCRKDNSGIMEVTFSQLGLFIASAILLTVVFMFVFSNDWQRTTELQSLTSDFSNLLTDVTNLFFDTTYQFQFPEKPYQYRVFLSTEYMVVQAQGSWQTDLINTKRLLVTVWPRLSTQNWTTGAELRRYLNETYGHQGTQDDPLSHDNFTGFLNEQNNTAPYFALHPFEIELQKPVVLEKVRVYHDSMDNHTFLLIYQHS